MKKRLESMSQLNFALLLFVIPLFVISGCGSDKPTMGQVRGIVTVGGKVAPNLQVNFQVKESPRISVGVTDDKGEFVLTTFDTGDGAIVGENLVSFREMQSSTTDGSAPISDSNRPSPPVQLITGKINPSQFSKAMSGTGKDLPQKYTSPSTSGIKRSVVPGSSNVFKIDLDKQ